MPTNVIKQGWVTFAGAGPGAPDLLTVRCRNAIAEADVIVYAGSLVNPEILSFAPSSCRLYDSAGMDLLAITDTLISAARRHLKVLRLHTGDPSIYGAIAEQMNELDAAHIPYEVIPGVSAVFAAAAAVRAELTLPEISQTLILSRRAGRTPVPKGEELQSLAAHGATLALYLSVSDMEGVTDDLLRGGYAPDTPAAIVYRASWPDEKIISGTLVTIAEQVRQAGIERQAVILVGQSLKKDGGAASKLYDPAFSHGFRTADKNTIRPVPPPSSTSFHAPFSGRVAVYALTESGCQLGKEIAHAFQWDAYLARRHFAPTRAISGSLFPFDPRDLGVLLGETWPHYDAHLFFMATGIVVRKIAPLLKDKTCDPALVVCDEKGRHAISLAGGHMGGANRLATEVAHFLGGEAVISTATDIQGLPAFDEFAAARGMEISNPENIKRLNTLLLEKRKIAWISAQGSLPDIFQGYPNIVPTESLENLSEETEGAVLIGSALPATIPDIPILHLRPLPLAVGIGCKRGTLSKDILKAINRNLERFALAAERIQILASIELKADENGLLEAAGAQGWQTRFFSAEELEGMAVPSPSSFVRSVTGSASVAEAAALAAGQGRLLIPKQIEGSVTVAVATLKNSLDTHSKNAALQVVGIGPGTIEGMTRQALEAIQNAQVIVGYKSYCDQVADLVHDKRVLSSGMREEITRCDQALDLAMEGHSVALICSGDAGIYGMAGLVFERIEARKLDFDAVGVIPGVTAASLAASALGAPLMNDFAVISLSDLLTGQKTILRRLEHIARSGMSCALYNPRSNKRRDLIVTAIECFRKERGVNTASAIVSHAGRPEETVWTGPLAEMPVEEINMSSIVLIGGEKTRLMGKWMVEPRGYAIKEDFYSEDEV